MIVVGKLVDGTEIIGELVKESENDITIAHPMQIVYKYSMTSHQPSVSFARYMMFADQSEFDFQKVDFFNLAQAVPEIISVYRRMTRSLEDIREVAESPTTAPSDSKSAFYEMLLQSLESDDMTKH